MIAGSLLKDLLPPHQAITPEHEEALEEALVDIKAVVDGLEVAVVAGVALAVPDVVEDVAVAVAVEGRSRGRTFQRIDQ